VRILDLPHGRSIAFSGSGRPWPRTPNRCRTESTPNRRIRNRRIRRTARP